MLIKLDDSELESVLTGLDTLRQVLRDDDERKHSAEALADHIRRAPRHHAIVIKTDEGGDVSVLSDSRDLSDLVVIINNDEGSIRTPVVDEQAASQIAHNVVELRDRRALLRCVGRIHNLVRCVDPILDGAQQLRAIIEKIKGIIDEAAQNTQIEYRSFLRLDRGGAAQAAGAEDAAASEAGK